MNIWQTLSSDTLRHPLSIPKYQKRLIEKNICLRAYERRQALPDRNLLIEISFNSLAIKSFKFFIYAGFFN